MHSTPLPHGGRPGLGTGLFCCTYVPRQDTTTEGRYAYLLLGIFFHRIINRDDLRNTKRSRYCIGENHTIAMRQQRVGGVEGKHIPGWMAHVRPLVGTEQNARVSRIAACYLNNIASMITHIEIGTPPTSHHHHNHMARDSASAGCYCSSTNKGYPKQIYNIRLTFP